jgi:hypothetical protein
LDLDLYCGDFDKLGSELHVIEECFMTDLQPATGGH